MIRTATLIALGLGALLPMAGAPSASAAPVTLYTTDFTGANGSQPTGFTAFADPGMNSAIDTNEYEQERSSANGYAVGYYSVADAIATGAWRDVTVTTQTRFSGHPNNVNGLVLRARDITSASGSGDFYHVRMENNNLVLYRFNNGAGTSLASANTTESIAAAANRWLRVSIENVPNPETDRVLVHAELFKDAAMTQRIADLQYLDTSTSAITRSGGVGYRSLNTTNTASRSVFDNLSVTTSNTSLLWYDDYSTGTAPRMTSYVTGATQSVTSRKYQFDDSGAGTAVALAFVDFPAFTQTAPWENVMVSALMRTGLSDSGVSSGLVLRANNITGATGSGDYYMFRLNKANSQAELYRANGGSLVLLGSAPASSIPASTNIFIQATAYTIEGGVWLSGVASLNSDFSSPIATLGLVDTSALRLLGPGSAGFRVFSTPDGWAANFDNFTVQVATIPEPSTLVMAGLGMALLAGWRGGRRPLRR